MRVWRWESVCPTFSRAVWSKGRESGVDTEFYSFTSEDVKAEHSLPLVLFSSKGFSLE